MKKNMMIDTLNSMAIDSTVSIDNIKHVVYQDGKITWSTFCNLFNHFNFDNDVTNGNHFIAKMQLEIVFDNGAKMVWENINGFMYWSWVYE